MKNFGGRATWHGHAAFLIESPKGYCSASLMEKPSS